MNEMSGVEKTAAKPKVTKLNSKTQVTMERAEKKEALEAAQAPKEAAHFEIKMEEANHAFALITEIREKIETAYEKLVSSQDK